MRFDAAKKANWGTHMKICKVPHDDLITAGLIRIK